MNPETSSINKFLVGIVLGFVVYRRNSLLPGMVAHLRASLAGAFLMARLT